VNRRRGGIETMLTANWTAKLEYLYVDLRGGVFNDVVPGFGVVPEKHRLPRQRPRAGLNYEFDWYRQFVTKKEPFPFRAVMRDRATALH
jgi:hypothetical protein